MGNGVGGVSSIEHRFGTLGKEIGRYGWARGGRCGLNHAPPPPTLSLYCTLAWRGVCTGFNVSGRATGDVIAASCWTGGLAVLVEKKSRRMELALYCVSRVGG